MTCQLPVLVLGVEDTPPPVKGEKKIFQML